MKTNRGRRSFWIIFACYVGLCLASALVAFADQDIWTDTFYPPDDATGAFGAFSWNWSGINDQHVQATVTGTTLSGWTPVLRMGQRKDGGIVLQATGTVSGTTNMVFALVGSNIPPIRNYFMEFAATSNGVSKVLAQGMVNVYASLFGTTNWSSFIPRVDTAETDPVWTAAKSGYATTTALASTGAATTVAVSNHNVDATAHSALFGEKASTSSVAAVALDLATHDTNATAHADLLATKAGTNDLWILSNDFGEHLTNSGAHSELFGAKLGTNDNAVSATFATTAGTTTNALQLGGTLASGFIKTIHTGDVNVAGRIYSTQVSGYTTNDDEAVIGGTTGGIGVWGYSENGAGTGVLGETENGTGGNFVSTGTGMALRVSGIAEIVPGISEGGVRIYQDGTIDRDELAGGVVEIAVKTGGETAVAITAPGGIGLYSWADGAGTGLSGESGSYRGVEGYSQTGTGGYFASTNRALHAVGPTILQGNTSVTGTLSVTGALTLGTEGKATNHAVTRAYVDMVAGVCDGWLSIPPLSAIVSAGAGATTSTAIDGATTVFGPTLPDSGNPTVTFLLPAPPSCATNVILKIDYVSSPTDVAGAAVKLTQWARVQSYHTNTWTVTATPSTSVRALTPPITTATTTNEIPAGGVAVSARCWRNADATDTSTNLISIIRVQYKWQ